MSIFKFKSPTGITWPPLVRSGTLLNAYQSVNNTQWLSSKEIEDNQIRQLNTLLKHCYDNSPFYRMAIDKSGLAGPSVSSLEEFRKIPTLSRLEYQNYFNFIKIDRLPEGFRANKEPIFTSGTTGVPISVYKTNIDEIWWQALAMRDLEWRQMDPTKTVGAIKLMATSKEKMEQALRGVQTPAWIPTDLFDSSPAYAVDIRLEPNAQLNWLKHINPNYLISLPSNLDVLSNIVRENDLKFSNLELIQVIGETLLPEVKSNIESAFGVPVRNLYSSNECGYMASECPEGHGMHVCSESIIAEVLNDDNEPCGPGETGRLVVTSLSNFVTPFVRYEILDYVTLADGPCPCGRGLPLWKQIKGRMHPMLYLRNGTRKASTGIMLGLRQIGGVHQFQVIQKSVDHFIANVVPNKEWTAKKGNAIIKCIQDEVESDVRVELCSYNHLDRANGKLKIIVVEGK